MLSEFYITTEDFEEQLKACTRELAGWKDVHHIQRQRMADLGQDMLSFRESFVRAHINATMWVMDGADEADRLLDLMPKDDVPYRPDTYLSPPSKEAIEAHQEVAKKVAARMLTRQKSKATVRSQESAGELMATYKAYFFFIRAFQDACYGVLLNINGSTPGAYSSMHQAIKKKVPKIYAIPGYVSWFNQFKAKRDQIKVGVNVSLCGPQWDVGVGFNRMTPEGGMVVDASPNENKVRLGDLVASFQYSMELLRVIRRDIPRS